MNGERKEFNKYCGLIMFEPPSQPLNQSIAAGAADVDAFHSINYYNNNNNNNNNEKLPGCLKIKNEKRPPRPPNAFILYRREKQPAILATNRHMTNAEISRYIADLWKNESNETRLMWERYADQQKLNHMKAYPNYVYRPNKSRNEKRRQQRRKQRKATTGSNNNNNNNSNDVVDDTSAGSNIATPDISTPITTPIVDITNNTISPTTNTAATNNAAISMIPMSMGINNNNNNNNNIYYNPPMDINNYFTQQPEQQNVRNNNDFGIVIPQQIVPSSYPISPSSYTSSPISTTSSSPSLNSNSTSSSILSSGPMNHLNNENENNNYLYDNDSNNNNNNNNNLIYDNNNNNNNNLIYDNNNICDDSVNGLRLGFSDFLHDPSIINTVYNPNLIDEILRMEYQNYLGGGI
ncbi:hypothetical protein Glove_522g90 [Diversispora epigaea]|uniref:HMG box domain-containing protein n=1 Tax=Diversispora epigaea TaxID=1348612 RepID=A0A397GGQ7_9GLOM|nr:hypothetical protein Glove_522g90 [Diversispora epigaea]